MENNIAQLLLVCIVGVTFTNAAAVNSEIETILNQEIANLSDDLETAETAQLPGGFDETPNGYGQGLQGYGQQEAQGGYGLDGYGGQDSGQDSGIGAAGADGYGRR